MKRFFVPWAVILTMFCVTAVHAETYQSKGHKVSVSGTSTLHDWECPANKLYSKGDLTINNGDLQAVNSLWVEVEVKSIKSEKEAMDEKIYEALKADNAPKITFQLLKTKSIEKKGSEWVITANGTLTVAGNAQNVDLQVTAKIMPNGEVHFQGSKKMKMTTFKVDPPTAMWGVIKSGDDITVSFEMTMKKG